MHDIPRPTEGVSVLALVPFRQIAERGFDVHDDGAPLRVLRPSLTGRVPVRDLGEALPRGPVDVPGEQFSVSDEEYAVTVARVVALLGPALATIQGHAESVLSRDGLLTLHGLLRHALGGDQPSGVRSGTNR